MTGDGRQGIALRLAEAPESDVGLGRARVDTETRAALGLDKDGVVEISGSRTTAATLFPLASEDEGKGIIRVDGLVRRNLGLSLADTAEVRTATVRPAEHVTLAPVVSKGHLISFGEGIANFVRNGLLKRPVTHGDVVIVPGIALMGGALPFAITGVKPEGIVIVSEGTVFEISEKPVRDYYLVPPGERFTTFLHELRDLLRARLSPIGVDLKGLQGRDAENASRLVDAMRQLLDDVEKCLQDTRDRGG